MYRSLVLAGFLLSAGFSTLRGEELYVVSVEATELRFLFGHHEISCGSSAWSPDSRTLAFDTWGREVEDFQDARVATLAIDAAPGTQPTDLGPGAMPSWSPDGRAIVCHTYNPSTCVAIAVDGSHRQPVIGHWGSPRWGARLEQIFSILGSRLAESDLETGAERVVTSQGRITYGFSISHDGKRCCGASTGRGLLLYERADAGESFELSKTLAPDWQGRHVSWAPDGRRVVAMLKPPEAAEIDLGGVELVLPGVVERRWSLYTIDVDEPGAEPKRLPQAPVGWQCVDPAWSPDGRWIAFTRSN